MNIFTAAGGLMSLFLPRRHGGYVLFTNAAGLRHAVRATAVQALGEIALAAGGGTHLVLPGGRTAAVEADLETCLATFDSPLSHTRRR